MHLDTWIELLGKNANDPPVQLALAAAGVKKIPKRASGDFSVIFELKGHHLWLELTTEAFHRNVKRRGKTQLIVTSVEAVLVERKAKGGYQGPLPLGLTAGMTQAAVREVLGSPSTIVEDVPADIWLRDGREVNATYTRDLQLQLRTLALTLPNED